LDGPCDTLAWRGGRDSHRELMPILCSRVVGRDMPTNIAHFCREPSDGGRI